MPAGRVLRFIALAAVADFTIWPWRSITETLAEETTPSKLTVRPVLSVKCQPDGCRFAEDCRLSSETYKA